MVAIGGWGDSDGFSQAAASGESRKLFAKNVKAMVDETGADGNCRLYCLISFSNWKIGVDIDWEYPGYFI